MSKRPCYECKYRKRVGFTYEECTLTARDAVDGTRTLTRHARMSQTCKPEPTLLIKVKELFA